MAGDPPAPDSQEQAAATASLLASGTAPSPPTPSPQEQAAAAILASLVSSPPSTHSSQDPAAAAAAAAFLAARSTPKLKKSSRQSRPRLVTKSAKSKKPGSAGRQAPPLSPTLGLGGAARGSASIHFPSPPAQILCRLGCGKSFGGDLASHDIHVNSLCPARQGAHPSLISQTKNSIQCPLPSCGVLVPDSQSLLAHISTHHGSSQQPRHPQHQPPHQQTVVQCPLCARSLASRLELVGHISQDHGPNSQVPSQSFHLPAPGASLQPPPFQNSAPSYPQQPDPQSLLAQLAALLQPQQSAPHPPLHQPPAYGHLSQQGQAGFLPDILLRGAGACGREPPLKSGEERTVNPTPRYRVIWPHEAFDPVSGQSDTPKYKDLSGAQLAAGLVRTLLVQPDQFTRVPRETQLYLQYVSFLLHALSASGNLTEVLKFNKLIMLLMEQGQFAWTDDHAPMMQSLQVSFRASLRKHSVTDQGSSEPGKDKKRSKEEQQRFDEAKRVLCQAFQSNSCSESSHHSAGKHFCKYCFFKRNRNEPHPPSACPSDPRKK